MIDTIENLLTLGLYPFVFLSLYFQVFMLFNWLDDKSKAKEKLDYDYFPEVTFIIPAWNEGRHVATTLDSLLALDYREDKLFFYCIDNNSRDNTKDLILSYVNKDKRIKYFFEPKQGKHNALNLGLQNLKTEYVSCLDADSTLDKDALKIAMNEFKNEKVMAVLPCIQIRSPQTVWQKMQVIEYLISIFLRKAYSTVDAIQVLPGSFSTFRREVFDQVGGYISAYNGEDFEMTLRMHKNNMKIANAHKAHIYTVGPSTFKSLYKQRVRWYIGLLKNAWDYRYMFFNKKYGNFGLFTFPVTAIFIIYVIYAIVYALWNIVRAMSQNFENWNAAGLSLNWPHPDLFYIPTNVLVVISIFFFTILASILIIANNMTNSSSSIIKKMPMYILIYPFVTPVFLMVAIYKVLRNQEYKWHLQDNKV